MVNGRLGRARAPSAAFALLLLVACGGKSVSVAGGVNAGTGGLAGNAGPSIGEMLTELCTSICRRSSEAACEGNDLDQCVLTCSEYVDTALKSSCTREAHDYFACIDALPDICKIIDGWDLACEDDIRDAADCAADYCHAHPDERTCRALGVD